MFKYTGNGRGWNLLFDLRPNGWYRGLLGKLIDDETRPLIAANFSREFLISELDLLHVGDRLYVSMEGHVFHFGEVITYKGVNENIITTINGQRTNKGHLGRQGVERSRTLLRGHTVYEMGHPC